MTIQDNVKNTDTWLRIAFVILFGVIFYIMFWIIGLLVLFQLVTRLITGRLNGEVHKVCVNLTNYINQILVYITFQSNERPFPFSPWPKMDETALPEEPEPAADAAENPDSPSEKPGE